MVTQKIKGLNSTHFTLLCITITFEIFFSKLENAISNKRYAMQIFPDTSGKF